MVSSTFDLTIRAGDDQTLVVTWLPDGTATNLTGASAEMTIAWPRWPSTGNFRGGAGSLEFSTADETIVIDVAANTLTVHMAAETTALLLSPEATYQLRVQSVEGIKTTIASGKVVSLRNLIDA